MSPTRSAGSSAPHNPVLIIASTFFLSFNALKHQRLAGPVRHHPPAVAPPACLAGKLCTRPSQLGYFSKALPNPIELTPFGGHQ